MIGLPSLQAMDRAQGARIWMASEATDMRCGFDRLAKRVRAVIGENPPQSGHLFVFRSRRGDRLKILVWDRDGFVLWYKRLEVGVFKIPRVEQGARSVELHASELAIILDGIDVSKLKRVPCYQLLSLQFLHSGQWLDLPVPIQPEYTVEILVTPSLPSDARLTPSLPSSQQCADFHLHVAVHFTKGTIGVADSEVVYPSSERSPNIGTPERFPRGKQIGTY